MPLSAGPRLSWTALIVIRAATPTCNTGTLIILSCWLRWASRMPGSVTVTRTDDAGEAWSDVFGTRLIQRDSAVAGVRLADGSLLAAYNNSAWDRRDLSLARSADEGLHWSKPHPLEHDTTPNNLVRREYSYPFLLQTHDGRYHLVYTWQRKMIRHVVFDDAWVLGDPQLAVPRG